MFSKYDPLVDTAKVLEKKLCLCFHGTYLLCLASDIIASIFINLAKDVDVYGKKFEETRNVK